jgi:membrane-bound serine protease (ClpP class)
MWELIIGLAVAGLLLIGIELFVPGMVLGTLGAAALVASITLAFVFHGFVAGSAMAVCVLVCSTIGTLVWLRLFPHTAIGKKLTLSTSLGGPNEYPDFSGLMSREGVTLTILRPAGTAVFDGKRIDVVTDGEFIDPGNRVAVVAVEGARVVVRKR